MRLDSLSNARTEGRQQVPQFLASRDQRTDIVGEWACDHCRGAAGAAGHGVAGSREQSAGCGERDMGGAAVDRVTRGMGAEGAHARVRGHRARGTRGTRRTAPTGTQNLSGQSVFSVVPVEGILEPSRAQDFTVTFSPDHESLYFSDQLQVMLFDKVGHHPPTPSPPGAQTPGGRTRPLCSRSQTLSHQILLKGAAREHMMFVEGGDPLDVPVESLTMTPTLALERREGEIPEGRGPHRWVAVGGPSSSSPTPSNLPGTDSTTLPAHP